MKDPASHLDETAEAPALPKVPDSSHMDQEFLHGLTAAARWRGESISEQRAVELAADLCGIVGLARAVAETNEFSDEPFQFATVLAALARQDEAQP
jgi:hypothetical protein